MMVFFDAASVVAFPSFDFPSSPASNGLFLVLGRAFLFFTSALDLRPRLQDHSTIDSPPPFFSPHRKY